MDELPSKTQRKKQMHDLQDVGAELVGLSEQQLQAIGLPERLRDAVMEARRVTQFEARRRQLQYIGKLMRSIDAEPIREQLARFKVASHEQTARLHTLERWRQRLLDDQHAVAELAARYPGIDTQRVCELIANAARERAQALPPKSFRALFRFLDQNIDRDRP